MTRDSWKRLVKRMSTINFWKRQFLASPLTKAFCWVVRSLSRLLRRSDCLELLLYCKSVQEAQHLQAFSLVFRDDERLRFNVMIRVASINTPELYALIRKLLPFSTVSEMRAYLCEWDMIVVADHPPRQLLLCPRSCPTLYIGHGLANTSTPGCSQTRPYGDLAFDESILARLCKKKRPIYSRMFEGEEQLRNLAIKANPSLSSVVTVVGNLSFDEILAKVECREEFRKKLGIAPNEIVVFVISTWRPASLIESVGDEFLEESAKLLEDFKFIISVHPNEYVAKPEGQRVWGEYLRTQKKYGYIIREPEEGCTSYFAACDIVLTDHTCLSDHAIIIQKPIICVPVDPEFLWKGSITWQLYQFAPILHDMRSLRDALCKAKTVYPVEKLAELANSMNPYPGKAAERIRGEVYKLLQIRSDHDDSMARGNRSRISGPSAADWSEICDITTI